MEQVTFPHKINRKLTLAFAFLVSLVLLVGGTSLYLARSIYLTTQLVQKESERMELVDQIHYTTHHFIEALERASLQVGTVTEGVQKNFLNEIRSLLRRYQTDVGEPAYASSGMWEVIRQLDKASEKIVNQLQQSPGETPRNEDLRSLAEIEGKVSGLAHWLSGAHRGKIEQMVQHNTWKMQVIIALYGAFVLVGVLFIVGSSFFFSRTIAQPLRSLAEAAREIALGNLRKTVPVESKDEIGQLSHAFNAMVERLREDEDRLHSLATLEERERIAQELHDTLAQELVVLQMKLDEAEMDLPQEASESIRELLRDIRTISERAYEDVRQAIFGLRTMVSKGLGLIPTLTEYLHDFSQMRSMSVDLKVLNPEPFQLSPQAEIQLIHIIHEALTNSFRHSQAKKSAVTFDRDSEYVKVMITDDGLGFNPQEATNGFHVGLKTMRERAEGVRGKLTVESAPGKGTQVTAFLPVKDNKHESDSNLASR